MGTDPRHPDGEQWLWPAFLKEALRNPWSPSLAWEEHFIDRCFLGHNGEHLARFEFKPFFPVLRLKIAAFGDITKDFSKQWERSKASPAVEHHVVLVPYGQTDAISTWVSETLLPTIKRDYPDMRLKELPSPSPIKLNRSEEGYAILKVFQVGSVSNR
jgi:hypothetical protein